MSEKVSENFTITKLQDSEEVAIKFYYWYAGNHTIVLDNLEQLRELGDLITAALGEQCDNTLSGSLPVPTSQNTPAAFDF